MEKKGSSRKGARRRQAIEAAGPRDDTEFFRPAMAEEPIRLDLATDGIVKEIARIETPIHQEAPRLTHHIKDKELIWGSQPAKREQRWIWASFAIAGLLLFGAIAVFNHPSNEGAGSAPTTAGFEVITEIVDENSPLFVFEKNFEETQKECVKKFRQFAAAQHVKDILPLIRQHSGTSALLEKHWQPWRSQPILEGPDAIITELDETNGRGFLRMQGFNQDGSPFLVFFVAAEGSFLLDWEATLEIGDARLSNMARDPTVHPLCLRVIISPSNYYLPSMPESDYESYQISDSLAETTVWGYVKRDTAAHKQISDLLQQNSPLLEPKQQARITLFLKKTDEAVSQNRFLITEVLHKDWVMP